MNNYQFEPYENNKNLNAFRITNNGNDLVAAIVDAVETGLENTGITNIKTNYVEISDTTPVTIPPGMYDGTAKAKLSDSALAEIDEDYIAIGHSILGIQGKFLGADTLSQYFFDTLTEVENDNIVSLNPSTFENKINLQSVSFLNLTELPNRVFCGCTNLSSINIPLLSKIGESTFENCLNIEEFQNSNIEIIPKNAFYGDKNLKNVLIPNVISIGQSSFSGCSSIKTLNVSNASTIGQEAFKDCSGLENINVDKLTKFEYAQFSGCSSLKEIRLPQVTSGNHNSGFVTFGGCNSLKLIDFGKKYNIHNYCFKGCIVLKTLILRATEICSIQNIDAVFSTPFASNGSGGTLYVPQALIEDYKAATNWSVILAYPNNQILSIEGSEYEITEEADSNE